jgi:hypothetical protein
MNRFETLLAPPSLTPRELAIHIRMHPEIPAEVSGACRNELVRVGVRLHDELTTVRFATRLAETPAPPQYSLVNRRLTGSSATPIDWMFFAAEFEAFTAEHPEQLGVKDLRSVLAELDPWRTQAWSAQALRIAQNAETEDPDHAASAWRIAVRLYQAFFARADVTESHTYRIQTDPAAQAACRAAWDSFLPDQVDVLARRVAEYSSRQQAAAVSAALAALAVRDVVALNPDAARRAKVASQSTFLDGMKAAATLRAAYELYSRAPASDEMDRALLGVMAAETSRLAKGFGGEDEVSLLEKCGEVLGLRGTPDDQVGSLMRSARTEFYESATALARAAINDDGSRDVKTRAARVLELVPPDLSAGKGPRNETITVGEVIGALSGEELAPQLQGLVDTLIQAPKDSAAAEHALDHLIEFGDSHRAFVNAPQVAKALAAAYSAVFTVEAIRSLAAPRSRGLRMMRKIQKALPPEATIDISGTAHTAADWIGLLQARGSAALPPKEQFNALRKRLLDAPVASAKEAEALSETLSFVRGHSLATDDREWLKRNLVVVFTNSAAAYLEDPLANERCLRMMEQIVDYLPPSTQAEFGGEDATLKDHLQKLRILGPLLSDLKKSGQGSGRPPQRPHTTTRAPSTVRKPSTTGRKPATTGRPSSTGRTPSTSGRKTTTTGRKTTTRKPPKRKPPKRVRSRRRNENLKTGFACVVAALLWVAIITGWSLLVWWVWGLVAGNTILQVTVLVLAVVLPVLGMWRVAKS